MRVLGENFRRMIVDFNFGFKRKLFGEKIDGWVLFQINDFRIYQGWGFGVYIFLKRFRWFLYVIRFENY